MIPREDTCCGSAACGERGAPYNTRPEDAGNTRLDRQKPGITRVDGLDDTECKCQDAVELRDLFLATSLAWSGKALISLRAPRRPSPVWREWRCAFQTVEIRSFGWSNGGIWSARKCRPSRRLAMGSECVRDILSAVGVPTCGGNGVAHFEWSNFGRSGAGRAGASEESAARIHRTELSVGAECGGRRRGGRDAEAIAEALISSSSALQKEKTVEADNGMVLDCAAN